MCNGEHDEAPQVLIAVVDDDQSVRAALSNLLHSAGYAARSFDTAEAFLASDCVQAANCAIVDVGLTGMNGFELKERLRRLDLDLPVVFISGLVSRVAQERAAQSGAAAFLAKPIEADTLLAQIKRIATVSGENE
ncbi:response regulator transcription factor [Herbaspirillum sp. RV1423]|uniref:response regulator transcription factor n=1 Tax=Herbaspirillum sp. RV1423 TaxID=1443993 RepID=UPI0004B8C4B8|nr:response regulator [Herbaspirillum sp. RV1423]